MCLHLYVFLLSQKPKDRSKEIPPRGQCLVQARQDLHSEYRNSNGHTYINGCCRTCYSLWRQTFKCGEGRICNSVHMYIDNISTLSEYSTTISALQSFDEVCIGFREQQRERHFRGEHCPSNFAVSRQSHNSLRWFVALTSVGYFAKCT